MGTLCEQNHWQLSKAQMPFHRHCLQVPAVLRTLHLESRDRDIFFLVFKLLYNYIHKIGRQYKMEKGRFQL